MDKLDKMFEIQNKAQEELGTWGKIGNDEKMKQQFINQMVLACHEEIVEITRSTAYKNPAVVPFGWKKQQHWDEEQLKEEIIDLMHFTMALFLTVGGTSEEFFEIYKKKNKKNLERWNGDY